MPNELPQLAYSHDALEPYIDAKTMEIHHDKHHQAYTDKFNGALEKHPQLFEKSVIHLLTHLDEVPEDIRTAVRNNGGGYYNHALFWEILSPDGKEPSDELSKAFQKYFGGLDKFKETFSTSAAGQFGSGWAWLSVNSDGELIVNSLPNQDNPLSQGMRPILCLDVWEHAYYLKYQNRRPEYIENFWHVVNWKTVNEKYQEALKK